MENNKKQIPLKEYIPESETKYFDWDNIVLKLGVMSDTHIGDPNTKESFRQGLQFMKKLCGSQPDAFLHAGDLSNSVGSGNDNQITAFKKIYSEEVGNSAPLIYCLGPTHDMSKDEPQSYFRNKFWSMIGEEFSPTPISAKEGVGWFVRHSNVQGFNFLCVDWSGGNQGIEYTADDEKWLKAKIEECISADENKPLFILLHGPWIEEMINTFRGYSQIICFTGHSHNSISREDSIMQDKGYTQMHCGGMDYYRVDGYKRFYSDPFLNLGDKRSIAQSVLALVDKNGTTLLIRLECWREKVIFPCYEISKENFGEYVVARFANGRLCEFPRDAKLKIKRVGENSAEISFSPCKSGVGGPPLYYTVKVFNKNSENEYFEAAVLDPASQEVYYPNGEGMPEYITTVTAENVDLTDFAVTVTATCCRGKSLNALAYTNGNFKYDGVAVENTIIE